MVDNYRPEIEELEERIEQLEEQAFAGRDAAWCGRCSKLKRDLAIDAAHPRAAA